MTFLTPELSSQTLAPVGHPPYLAKGKSGSVTYGTVEASPHRYVFTLYGLMSNRLVELASVEVSGATQ